MPLQRGKHAKAGRDWVGVVASLDFYVKFLLIIGAFWVAAATMVSQSHVHKQTWIFSTVPDSSTSAPATTAP